MDEPERLQRRPHVGMFPIPFVTARINGKPDFRVHNDERRKLIGKRKLCQLCGYPLGGDIVFAGSRSSIRRHTYGEPPMHEECAQWAVEVCPWLAGRGWRYEDEFKREAGGVEWLQQPRLVDIGFVRVRSFRMIRDDERPGGVKYEAGEWQRLLWAIPLEASVPSSRGPARSPVAGTSTPG